MKPTLDLARELASAVLDQVERDGALHDVRIAEAILARMAVCEAREPSKEAAAGSVDAVMKAADDVIEELYRELTRRGGHTSQLLHAYKALNDARGAMRRAG